MRGEGKESEGRNGNVKPKTERRRKEKKRKKREGQEKKERERDRERGFPGQIKSRSPSIAGFRTSQRESCDINAIHIAFETRQIPCLVYRSDQLGLEGLGVPIHSRDMSLTLLLKEIITYGTFSRIIDKFAAVVVAQGNPGIGSVFYVEGIHRAQTVCSMTLSDPSVIALKSDSEANL